MNKITVTKIIKDGYDTYKFAVNGVETTASNLKEQHHLILGINIRFDYWGLFSGVDSKTNIEFNYGKFHHTFEWEKLASIETPVKEMVNNLKKRIAVVKEWIKTLPEDSEESVTFNV